MEKKTYLKFLVSNASAGSVIGKGGSTITDFQKESGAHIQLSRNQDFFPGTADRIILLSGKIDQVLKAMDLILNKLLSEVHGPPHLFITSIPTLILHFYRANNNSLFSPSDPI